MTDSPEIAEVADPINRAALDMLQALGRLDAHRLELEARSDLAALARMLVAVGEVMLNLGSIGDSCEQAIADIMKRLPSTDPKTGEPTVGVRKLVLDDVGVIRRKASYTDSYDSSALFRLLVDKAVADPFTGNIDIDLRNRVLNVISRAVPLSASTRWKKGGLSDLDIDLDEYTARQYGRDRIEIQ